MSFNLRHGQINWKPFDPLKPCFCSCLMGPDLCLHEINFSSILTIFLCLLIHSLWIKKYSNLFFQIMHYFRPCAGFKVPFLSILSSGSFPASSDFLICMHWMAFNWILKGNYLQTSRIILLFLYVALSSGTLHHGF